MGLRTARREKVSGNLPPIVIKMHAYNPKGAYFVWVPIIPYLQYFDVSLVPRPRPAFSHLQYRKVGEGLVSFIR